MRIKFRKLGAFLGFLNVFYLSNTVDGVASANNLPRTTSIHIVIPSNELFKRLANGWVIYGKAPSSDVEFGIGLEINCNASNNLFAFHMPTEMKSSSYNEFGFGKLVMKFDDKLSLTLPFTANNKDSTKLIPLKFDHGKEGINSFVKYQKFSTKIKSNFLGVAVRNSRGELISDFVVSFDLRQLKPHRKQIEKSCGLGEK